MTFHYKVINVNTTPPEEIEKFLNEESEKGFDYSYPHMLGTQMVILVTSERMPPIRRRGNNP